jgi:small conductance mechanosensitive channel
MQTRLGALSWLLLAAATCVSLPAQAQDGDPEEAHPVTTANPEIPIEHLRLLVRPLTREGLVVEADGWRDLVKSKVQEIAQQQIAVQVKLEIAEAAAEAEQAEEEVDAAGAKATPESQQEAATEAETAAEAVVEQKEELAKKLPELQEEQAQLIERLNVVVDALEKKGGDVEAYRQYISAVTGIDLSASDASTTWTVLRGWLTSEQGGQRWMWNILKFLAILAAFYLAASVVANLLRHAVSRVKGSSQLLVDFVGKFVKQLMIVIGLIVALAALEVNIGPLLAAVGAAGFVVAFALQDTLSNFASGLLILAYRPFDVGDVIEAAGVSGIVDSVSLFSTHIRSFDNKVMIVPNNDIFRGTITNATASDTRRVDLVFGIGYDDDVDRAKSLLEELVQSHELVLKDPAPVVQLHELADSSVNFICRPWTKTGDYWRVYWELTRSVKQAFDREGISIPFPQRDVHVYHENAGGGGRGSAERSD